MKSAGFHFGHDAGAAVMDADGVRHFMDKERLSRVKHALGLSPDDLRPLISAAGDDVLIGLSSTQDVPMFLGPGLEVDVDGGVAIPMDTYFDRLPADHHYRKFVTWVPDRSQYRGLVVPENLFPWASRLNQDSNRSYESLGSVSGQLSGMADAQGRKASLTLDGRRFDARFYEHHYLHAVYAGWAAAGAQPAIIITGDGGVGPSFSGGGIYHWTPTAKLLPLTPVDGWIGQFYDEVAERVGFAGSGGAGKLMGLAPYGRPIYFDQALVGTRWQVTQGYEVSIRKVVSRWLARFDIAAGDIPEWDLFSATPPILIADIAASAQLLLEMNIQELGRAAERIARRAGLSYDKIVLCGGVALNCPANSNLAVTLSRPVDIPPAVNDEGLSIGAAAAAYFDLTGHYPDSPSDYAAAAYIGTDVAEADVVAAAQGHGWSRVDGDAIAEAARLVLSDTPLGICAGRAEVGPRALGHRSLIFNAGSVNTWALANQVKRRELWRPFAPAVLLDYALRYFDRGPAESRYMLFNYRCNSKLFPAITHYDHSSRVQHVSPATGILHELLVAIDALGAPPVVLNTSFNGPGVPIVDSAEDAFAEATTLGVDYILTDFGLYRRG